MGIRDVAICVSSLESAYGLVDQASAMAEGWQAHLSCCLIGAQPEILFSDGPFGGQGEYLAAMQASEEAVQEFGQKFRQHLEQKGIAAELRETRAFQSGFAETASIFSRYCDLLVARMPARPDTHRHGELIEGTLFGAGRPVMVLPEAWKPRPLGHRILLAWDSSREASRAIHDALALLAAGADVCIATVDAQVSTKRHGEAPGLDIATHLARHGLKVTVQNADSLGRPVGERLAEIAQGFDADMIVMGGYRHSKLAQRILGGPSHFLIFNSPLPVFLSH